MIVAYLETDHTKQGVPFVRIQHYATSDPPYMYNGHVHARRQNIPGKTNIRDVGISSATFKMEDVAAGVLHLKRDPGGRPKVWAFCYLEDLVRVRSVLLSTYVAEVKKIADDWLNRGAVAERLILEPDEYQY